MTSQGQKKIDASQKNKEKTGKEFQKSIKAAFKIKKIDCQHKKNKKRIQREN